MPLINGKDINFSDIEILINGEPLKGVKDVQYDGPKFSRITQELLVEKSIHNITNITLEGRRDMIMILHNAGVRLYFKRAGKSDKPTSYTLPDNISINKGMEQFISSITRHEWKEVRK